MSSHMGSPCSGRGLLRPLIEEASDSEHVPTNAENLTGKSSNLGSNTSSASNGTISPGLLKAQGIQYSSVEHTE